MILSIKQDPTCQAGAYCVVKASSCCYLRIKPELVYSKTN